MRVQGTNTAISGPVGALPVPVPLREDAPFADHIANANRPEPSAPATRHGPLALAVTRPETADAPAPIPRPEAVRAYARASASNDQPGTRTMVSLTV
jgi:hypothetical protein